MPPGWKVEPPKDDDEYFERMTRSLFTAGLSWEMVEKKWPNFKKAFVGFSAVKVARFSDKQVKGLMEDTGIVRNEKKIAATIHNAKATLATAKEYGSFRKYLESFDKDEEGLQADIQKRFKHLGPSSSRTFLWSVGYPLTPNAEEKKWITSNKD
jgi:3-methyladenine DNA glycosylase Tag